MFEADAYSRIAAFSLIWGASLVVCLGMLIRSRHQTVGMPFAFLLCFTVVHGGALVHLVNGYDHTQNLYLAGWGFSEDTVADGLGVSVLAMVGAVCGFLLVELRSVGRRANEKEVSSIHMFGEGKHMVMIGGGVVLINTVMKKAGLSTAALAAFISNLLNFVAAGACCIISSFLLKGKQRTAFLVMLGCVGSVPVFFIITTGIIANSLSTSLFVFAFYLLALRHMRLALARSLALCVGIALIGFAFAVIYLQTRSAIREVVWGGGRFGRLCKRGGKRGLQR